MKSFKKFLGLLLAFAMMIPTSVAASPATNAVKILYTNDVHTYIDKDLSYATVSQLKKDLTAEGNTVFLIDAGDHAQGTAYGGMDNGKTMIDLMNAADYDLATFGNHEFNYGLPRLKELVDLSDATYLNSNIKYLGDGDSWINDLKPYEIVSYGNTKVGFIGITTPLTLSTISPNIFYDNQHK